MKKATKICITVDINKYPTINSYSADQIIEITEGDLHANFLRVLFTCTRYGIIKLDPEIYEQLVTLYYQQEKSNAELVNLDIAFFEKLLSKIAIVPNPKLKLRFIGDELCDRGRNDYFILKFISLLQKAGVKIEVIESNHGLETILAYESYETNDYCFKAPTISSTTIRPEHGFSLDAMEHLLRKGTIKKEIIDEIYKDYIKLRKLISYSLNEEKDKLILFSHAPIDLKTVKSAINKICDLIKQIETSERTTELLPQEIESKKQQIKSKENTLKNLNEQLREIGSSKEKGSKDLSSQQLANNRFQLRNELEGYQEELKKYQEKLEKAEKYKQFKQQFPEQLETIKAIPLVYDDETAVNLASSIDSLNKIYQVFLLNGGLGLLYSPTVLDLFYNKPSEGMASSSNDGWDIDLLNEYPFEFMSWNRYYGQLERVPEKDNYKIYYCHGHDSTNPSQDDHIINLDSKLGKYIISSDKENNEEIYRILYSEGYGPLKPEELPSTQNEKKRILDKGQIFNPFSSKRKPPAHTGEATIPSRDDSPRPNF